MVAVASRISETQLLLRLISAKGLAVRILSSLSGLPFSMPAGPVLSSAVGTSGSLSLM